MRAKIPKMSVHTLRNVQKQSGGCAVVTAAPESCGRRCNLALGQLRSNIMKEIIVIFVFVCGGGTGTVSLEDDVRTVAISQERI